MAAWRTLAGVAVLLAAVPAGRAQPYPLAETVKAGDCFRVRLEMKLTGELKVNRDGKVTPLPLTATATHEFPERVLSVGGNGLPEKVARVYEKASAAIAAADDRSQRSLRPERRLFVAQRQKDQGLVYSPAGPLLREELELTSEHFDTLALTGLLPGKAVAVGETWKVPSAVAQALCQFEGLTEQDLTCKLEEVKDNVARVSITGTAAGIELGALVKMKVEATYRFDLGAKRLVGLEWKQTDDRQQGPASPATSVETTTTVTRTPIEQPDTLDDVALVSVPDGFEPPPPLVQLEYRDPKGRFDLAYSRSWQTVSQTDEHLVMRLMERGDFVAQVTVTPWTAAEKGKPHLTPEEFAEAMARTPGWEPERELQAGEVPTGDDGRWVYRISALGEMDGTAVMQNFYLVANPQGEQVVLLFTMTPKKAEKLGDRDLSLAASVDFPKGRKGGDKPKQP
jgi:hypothetical protein